jgi:hypothetical protein
MSRGLADLFPERREFFADAPRVFRLDEGGD